MADVVIKNDWMFTVNLKCYLSECTARATILEKSKQFKAELQRLLKKVQGSRVIRDDYSYHLIDSLEDCIGEFDWLISLASGKVKEADWDDVSFDGDFSGYFNDTLSSFYDLADERLLTKNNESHKFAWVA